MSMNQIIDSWEDIDDKEVTISVVSYIVYTVIPIQ